MPQRYEIKSKKTKECQLISYLLLSDNFLYRIKIIGLIPFVRIYLPDYYALCIFLGYQ